MSALPDVDWNELVILARHQVLSVGRLEARAGLSPTKTSDSPSPRAAPASAYSAAA